MSTEAPFVDLVGAGREFIYWCRRPVTPADTAINGSCYYAELSDTFDQSKCSDFCRQTVIPLLDQSHVVPLQTLRSELSAWLLAAGPATLICDSRRDLTQLDRIFPDGLPDGCAVQQLGFLARRWRRIANIGHRVQRRHGLRLHHALDDAKANWAIFGGKPR